MLVVEHTQEIVSVHGNTVEHWVIGYNDLVKHQDAQLGYFFLTANNALGGNFKEFAKELGVSLSSIKDKVALYKGELGLAERAPEKTLAREAQKYKKLKGGTPEEKADNFEIVKKVTNSDNPTQRQITQIMKTIEAPIDEIKKNLRLERVQTPSNLNRILNYEEVLWSYRKRLFNDESHSELKREFMQSCKYLHPDHGGDEESWQIIIQSLSFGKKLKPKILVIKE